MRGYISVGRNEGNYFVTTGNYIDTHKTDVLSKRLDVINDMSRDDVKQYYKQALKESRINEGGGAGLGFIDMIKRTGNPIGYKFKKINDATSFVVINAKVSIR